MDHREAIRMGMSSKGMTQYETAKAAGYNGQSAVSMALQRENGMRVDVLVRIMDALGYSVMIKDRASGEEWQLDMKSENK